MTKITIYLRAVKDNKGKNQLSLFDSNRNANIDNLTTVVRRGDVVIWAKDSKSGIKRITKIYPESRDVVIFKPVAKQNRYSGKWELRIPKDAIGSEKYAIQFELCDGEKVTIDPTLQVRYP